jgi:hypothetical protein
MNIIKRYGKDLLAAINKERYYQEGDGKLLFFNGGVRLGLDYFEGISGDFRIHKNLLPDQAIRYLLNVGFGPTTTKISAWYIAPFSGSTAPTAAWTAANFTSNASEITATTPEGFSEATRQAATMVEPTAVDQIDNYVAKATFTTVTASTLSVTGVGLLSSNTRGGTSGTLGSAVKFTIARSLQNADPWQVGIRLVGAST